MNKLEQILKEKFPNKEIVKLEDLTYKIAGISKVRYGDNCRDNDYDEISLNYINEYGTIYVPDNSKDSALANHTALENQSLAEGDLIILHRGKIGKMGIIGDSYKRRIVGNNSMIRIQFDKNRKVDTPWFVMQYLQLPYVREYIDTYIPSSGSISRKILNPEVLSNLPIPIFNECDGKYKELLFTRKELYLQASRFNEKLQDAMSIYKDLQDSSVDVVTNNIENMFLDNEKDVLALVELYKIENQFTKVLSKYRKN